MPRWPDPYALTDRQRQVLEFIERFLADHGFPPTRREIGDALDIASTNGVTLHLLVLEQKGYLTLTPMCARGVRVLRSVLPVGDAELRRRVSA